MHRAAALMTLALTCTACSTILEDQSSISDQDYQRAIALINPALISQCERASRGLFPGATLRKIENSEGKFAPSDYSRKISGSRAIHLGYRSTLSYPSGIQMIGNVICRFTYNRDSDSIAFSGVFFE